VLVIDTGAMIAQVQGIIEQISQTISVVCLFTLFSGFAVLYAALLATQNERLHEAAILRTLGASGAYIRKLHLSEFAVLGALSGLLAALGAALLGWVLARFVLEIPYQLNPLVWLIGVFGGTAVVVFAAWLTTRRLVELPPLIMLRE
jgi:putative ABC transport system permease protein